jgi:hypothetical protein
VEAVARSAVRQRSHAAGRGTSVDLKTAANREKLTRRAASNFDRVRKYGMGGESMFRRLNKMRLPMGLTFVAGSKAQAFAQKWKTASGKLRNGVTIQ